MNIEESQFIGVIGCGNMGTAIARRLSCSGYSVLIGSRRPEHHQHGIFSVEVTSVEECIRLSSILFIAIYPEYYDSVVVSLADKDRSLFNGKVLIDLSNPTERDRKHINDILSNAERLQLTIPNAKVVKAFNTIPAFVMENTTFGELRCVLVASDDSSARDKVLSLARTMSFESYNAGSLRNARYIESSTQSLFPQWRMPVIVTVIVLLIWLIFVSYKKFVVRRDTSWNQLFSNITNKAFCASAITLLAIVYMPSNLAGIFQLAYGTKFRRFPAWLDKWLRARKQFGLLTFVLALCHAILSLILMSPKYYETWYQSAEIIILPGKNRTQIILPSGLMKWNGELAALLGVLAIVTMSILAVASIPAVGNLLNWREWQFIQSKLGTFTLLLAIGHVFAMATPRWINIGFVETLFSIGFPTVIFPVITMVLKFILCLPCFSLPINRIRRGEDRKQ